jgi:methylated-DNA-[protein]-cysteine S-methyltransferase
MKPLHRSFMRTPIGYIEVTCTDKGINSLVFLDFRVKPQHVPACLRPCIDQLGEYFSGQRRIFDLPLDLTGSPFQLNVWNALMAIPFGQTITYHDLAEVTGNKNAFRAVGGANSTNPVSVIIPCHRVIGSSGRLIGYRGGLKRKKWLLEHEHAFAQRDLFYGK